MHFNMYDIFYSQYSHHHHLAIFRVMFLLQEYNCGLTVSPSLHIN